MEVAASARPAVISPGAVFDSPLLETVLRH
jgi:hypothetical protein